MTTTITVTSLINKPGIGFVPFKTDTDSVEDVLAAGKLLEASRDLWAAQKGCNIVEESATTFTVEVSATQRLKFEVSE